MQAFENFPPHPAIESSFGFERRSKFRVNNRGDQDMSFGGRGSKLRRFRRGCTTTLRPSVTNSTSVPGLRSNSLRICNGIVTWPLVVIVIVIPELVLPRKKLFSKSQTEMRRDFPK